MGGRRSESWGVTVYTDKVTVEVKEGRGERIKGWRRGNILDGLSLCHGPRNQYCRKGGRQGQSRRYCGGGPEPGIYNETKKGYSVFLRRRFPSPLLYPPPVSSPLSPLCSPTLVSFPSRCTPLDLAVVEVHFIPTFNKVSRPPPGLY